MYECEIYNMLLLIKLNKILYPVVDIHILLSTSTRSTSIVYLYPRGSYSYDNDSEKDVLSRFRAVKCCDFLWIFFCRAFEFFALSLVAILSEPEEDSQSLAAWLLRFIEFMSRSIVILWRHYYYLRCLYLGHVVYGAPKCLHLESVYRTSIITPVLCIAIPSHTCTRLLT